MESISSHISHPPDWQVSPQPQLLPFFPPKKGKETMDMLFCSYSGDLSFVLRVLQDPHG